ncbi:centromere protein C [Actinidia rufa]|uniref:Centromere protein C n=1 Tax=Actinidia rufa TaxID=165716 RepID=A0A7J0FGI6_9ERIC|nr:centromere protein C [Actinidia rufa]
MDPLYGLSGLSLLPRTIRVSTDAPKPNHTEDIESIHNFMKSMMLRSPSKHSEQAKAIVDGNSELLNSNFASFIASENKNEDIAKRGKENAQERRPGLGRRRARFSLKPNSRRSVRYKHRYSSMLPESDDTFMSSQVSLGHDIFRPPGCISQPETADPDVELQEKELTGSISKTENRVNELLDELLSNNSENLDGDELLSFLQHRLQIKPLDLDKLCLPDFHDVGKNDVMDLEDNLPRPRNALSDIHNLMKGISDKTPVKQKQVAGSPVHSLASPTPPKSPFASISLLKKYLSHSDLVNDPFSPLNLSPARNSYSVEHVNEESDNYNTRKNSGVFGELKSPITETGGIRVNDTQEMMTVDSIILFEKSANDDSSRHGVGINDMSSGSHDDLIDNNVSRNTDAEIVDDYDSRHKTDMMDVRTNCPNEMMTGDSVTQFEKSSIDNSSRHGVGINDMSGGSYGDLIDNNGSRNMGAGIVNDNDSSLNTDTDICTNCPNEMEENDSRFKTDTDKNDDSSRHGVGINDMSSGSHVDLIDNNVSRNTDAEIVGDYDSRHKTVMMDVRTNCPNEMMTGDSVTRFEKSSIDNSSRHGVGINDMSGGSYGDLIDNNGSRNMGAGIVNDSDSSLNTDTDICTNCPNEMEENDSRFKIDTDKNDYSSRHGVGINDMSSGSHVDLIDDNVSRNTDAEIVDDYDSRHKTDMMDVRTNCPNEMMTGDSVTRFEKSSIDNSSRHGVGINDMSGGSYGDLIDNNGSRNMGAGLFQTDTDVHTSCPNEMEENNSRFKTDTDVRTSCTNEMGDNDNRFSTDVQENGPNEMEENVGEMLHEAVSYEDLNFGDSSRPRNDFQTDRRNEMENNVNQTDVPNEMEKNVENMPQNAQPDINIEHPTTGKLNDQSSPVAVGPHTMDEPSETSDVIPEQHLENVQEPSGVLLNERSSEKRPPRAVRKRKTLSHRQSLAGAGTSWESGVRRSKRIRMRPLEYWRGERFLYGRIHQSLTTVIGVKYVSPAKGDEGKPSIRVKSYVSDEYKELVELAALH